jgi:hypothetical protein
VSRTICPNAARLRSAPRPHRAHLSITMMAGYTDAVGAKSPPDGPLVSGQSTNRAPCFDPSNALPKGQDGLRGSRNVARGSISTPPGVFPATLSIKMMLRISRCFKHPLRQCNHTMSQQESCRDVLKGQSSVGRSNIYLNALNNPTLHEDHFVFTALDFA